MCRKKRETNSSFLKKHPLCLACLLNGRYRKATQVISYVDGAIMEPSCDACADDNNWLKYERKVADLYSELRDV